MNPTIIFASDALKLFNIIQDNSQLLTVLDNQTVLIAFDTNYLYSFEVCDRVQLFLHANFSDARCYYISENNESYHEPAKQYPFLCDSFDIWFSTNGTRLTTSEIDFLF
jgi:hypothetical protein